MKNLIILTLAALSLSACSKDNNNNPDNPGKDYPPKVKEAGEYRATNFHLDGWAMFTPDFYLHEFYAEERRDITSFQTFLTEPRRTYLFLRDHTEGLYGLRYVGNCKLIDPKKVYKVAGEVALYYLNDSLLGKPVFEIYELATNKTYQRYIASSDSCVVQIFRGNWTSDIPMDTAGYRKIYNALVDTGLGKKIYKGI